LLIKFLGLLLLVIVPISALGSTVNYQRYGHQLKSLVQAQQQAWTAARRDNLTITLVQEAERLEALGQDSEIPRRLQEGLTESATTAAAASRWQDAGIEGAFRYLFINSDAGLALSAYRQQFPNRTFTLLARADGALLAVTTPRWSEFDLTKFAWWPRAPLRDQVVIAGPQTIPGLDGNLLVILVPVGASTPGAPETGRLVVGLNFAAVVDPILTQVPSGETAWLAGADGTVLDTTAPGPPHLPAAWQATFTGPDGGGGEVPVGNAGQAADMLLAYAPLRSNLGYAQNDRAAIVAVNRLGWILVRSAPQSVAYAGLSDQLTLVASAVIVIFTTLLIMLLIIVRFLLLRPIRRLEQTMQAVAAGDLNARVPVRSQDELGRLGESFNRMVGELDALLRERIRRQQEQQGVGVQLQRSAVGLQSSAAQQDAVTTQQAEALAAIAATFAALSQSAGRIAEYGAQIAAAANVLQSEHQAGHAALAQTQTILDALRADSQSLDTIAEGLVRSSQAISTVIEQLNAIADETKLLALNATIEAAGAGPQGRRFAVIAAQVQSLADQSNESAEAAQTSLSEVKISIDQVVAAIQRELTAIAEGVRQSARLDLLMLTISDTIGQLHHSVDVIAQDSRQQKEGSQTAAASVEALAAAGKELAAQSASIHQEAIHLRALADRLYIQPADAGAPASLVRYIPPAETEADGAASPARSIA
jgi:methyl-accepting chemotaxis protein